MKGNILNSVNLNGLSHDYYFENLRITSKIAIEFLLQVKSYRQKFIFNEYLKCIEEKVNKIHFVQSDIGDILKFNDYILQFANPKKIDFKEEFLSRLRTHGYYLPLPKGEIEETHWSYCHLIYSLLEKVKEYLGVKEILVEAKSYLENLDETKSDKMLEFRIQALFR